MSSPLLTIITRCCRRPTLLDRCCASVVDQDSSDYEHVLVHDEEKSGLLHANSMIPEAAVRSHGEYVFVLDDDDYLICKDFVSGLAAQIGIQRRRPDVVFVKSYIRETLFPFYWNDPKMVATRGKIGANNFVVSRAFYCIYGQAWCRQKAGDYYFIGSIMSRRAVPQHLFWDKIVAQAEPSHGMSERERRNGMRHYRTLG